MNAPQSTIIVPMVLWDRIKNRIEIAEGPSHDLLVEIDRLEDMERHHQDPEEGSLTYQILDILAKSDGNLSTHLTRHTLNIMYGEMVRNLTETFTITRKDQVNGR